MSLGKKVTFAVFASSLLYGTHVPTNVFAKGTIETNAVMITTTRSEKDILDVPMSVSVITAEEISRKTPESLEDLLKNVPGVRIQGSGNNSNEIFIRGEDGGQTLVLIDGVKISAQYTTMDSQTQIPAIDPSIIERIEVIKGPASVLYGADALGGVINIITKKGGSMPIQGEIRTSYSTNRDTTQTSASIYGKTNGFSYRLSGAYENFGDIVEYHSSDDNTSRESNDTYAYLGYDFTDNLTAGITYNHKEDRYQNNDVDGREWTKRKTDSISADIIYRNVASFLPQIKGNFYYHTNQYTSPSYSRGSLSSKTVNSLDNYGLSLQTDWTIGDHTYIIAGYDWLHETYDDDRTYYSSNSLQVRDAASDTHAAYVSVEHTLPYDFTLNYGARFTHYSTDFDGSHTHSASGSRTTSPAKSGSESDIVFNAGLVWTGIDNLALRATFAQGYKPPSFYMAYLDIPMAMGNSFLSNPNLESEKIDNYEIGARYNNGKLLFDTALFYSKSKNRLDTLRLTIDGKGYTQWINQAESIAWGLEFLSSYKFDNGFEPYISGTWMRRKSSQVSGSPELEYDDDFPAFSTVIGVRYYNEVYENIFLNADLNMEYQTSQGGYTVIPPYSQEFTTREDFATVNLSVGAEFGEKKNFYTQLNINNLLDKKFYYNEFDDLEPGINGSIVFGYRF